MGIHEQASDEVTAQEAIKSSGKIPILVFGFCCCGLLGFNAADSLSTYRGEAVMVHARCRFLYHFTIATSLMS